MNSEGRPVLARLAWAFVAASIGVSAHVRAADLEPPALHWTRSESARGCIAPAVLAERVEQLTGTTLSRPAHALRSIEGQIESPVPEHYRVRITLTERGHDTGGQRVLEQQAKDCRELDGAIVFMVGMMVDPNLSIEGLSPALLKLISGESSPDQALLAELEQQQAPAANTQLLDPTESAPEPARPAPQAPKAEPKPPRATSSSEGPLEVRLAGMAQFNVAPGTLYGVDASLFRRLSPVWSLVGTLRGARSYTAAVVDSSSFVMVHAQAFDAALGVCVGTEREPMLRLRACLSPEYSLWRQVGTGFGRDRAGVLSGFGIAAGLDLRIRLRGRWWLHGFGALRISTLGRKFVYDQEGAGFTVPRAQATAGFGPGCAF
ncbi:MAG: hypothetical protein QM778_21425 [Myxococcales bacterium]